MILTNHDAERVPLGFFPGHQLRSVGVKRLMCRLGRGGALAGHD